MGLMTSILKFEDMNDVIEGVDSFELELLWWLPSVNDIDYIIKVVKSNIESTTLDKKKRLMRGSIVSVVQGKNLEHYSVSKIKYTDE